MTGPWLVRLGSKRGAGRYITHCSLLRPRRYATARAQIEARRFHDRRDAEVYARAFGGRVVRLRERGR